MLFAFGYLLYKLLYWDTFSLGVARYGDRSLLLFSDTTDFYRNCLVSMLEPF